MRLIDADALKVAIGEDKFWNYGYAICMIDDAPTVDPVTHGHFDLDDEIGDYICSVCGHLTASEFDMEEEMFMAENGFGFALRMPNYCKHCGAKMDGEVLTNDEA